MEQITNIFKDSSQLSDIIRRGYHVVVMGNALDTNTIQNSGDLGENSDYAEDLAEKDLGMCPKRLFFIFSDPKAKDNGENLRRIDANLNEVKLDYTPYPVIYPKWRKINLETHYPFECYVYTSGSLCVDGSSPEVRSAQYKDVVHTRRLGHAVMNRHVSYIALHKKDPSLYDADVVPSNSYPPGPNRIKVAITHESLDEEMMAYLDI